MAQRIRTCALLFAVLLLSHIGTAQTAKTSIFQSITKPEMPKITLNLDLTTVIAQKKTSNYFPAELTTSDGKKYQIEVKPRGKYRRKTCAFPPLKLKFKKKDLKAEGLDTLNEIKLTLPCMESDDGDDLVVKEYIVYKMFETLTQASIKAKLVRLTINDSHTGEKHTVMAILSEDEEETTARLNGQVVESYGLPLDSLQINQLATVVMFEYMIGNTDWDISMIRNVRTIRAPETGKIVVIPYDFDFSGFVGAPYASPSSDTGLKSVKDRFLYANGLSPEQLKKGSKRLLAARKEFVSLCRNKYLSREAQDAAIAYLESFFEKVEADKDMPNVMPAPPAE